MLPRSNPVDVPSTSTLGFESSPVPSQPRASSAATTGARPPGTCWIGVWADQDFVVLKAQVVNLTSKGLFAVADGTVRPGQTVWLRLAGAGPGANVPALVLGAAWLRRGRCALRLELPEHAPPGFYEELVRECSRLRDRSTPTAR